MKKRLLSVHAYLMFLFIYAPIFLIMFFSFNKARLNVHWEGFTWKWYGSLLHNRHVMDALGNSLVIAAVSTIFSIILGTIAALWIRATLNDRRISTKIVKSVLYLPIIIPDIIMGLSLLLLFTQFHIPLGKITVIIAHISFNLSYVFVVVYSRLSSMGKQLEEAASDLGATDFQTFRYIILPTIWPGMVAGGLIAFTLSIDDFMISFFVSGPNATTLPIYIYGLVKRGISPEINALCTLLIVGSVLLIIAAEIIRNRGTQKTKSPLFF